MKVINETLQKSARWKVKIPNLEMEYREKIKQLKMQVKNKEQECDKLKKVLAKISNIAELFCNTY